MRLDLAPLAACLSASLLLGCGDDATTPGDGGGTTQGDSTSTAGPDDSTGTPPDTTEGTTEGATDGTTGDPATSSTGADGSSSGDSTGEGESSGSSGEGESSGSSGGGMGMLDGEMSGLMIFQDCMPIVPSDPVGVSFTVSLTNTGDAPASASVVSATFVDGGGMAVGTIDVAPAVLGPVPVGDTTMTALMKVPNSLNPASGCGVVMCNQAYDLELVLEVDGVQSTISDNANVDCVF